MLHSICQPVWKTWQWPQDWKRSVFISITKKGNARQCSNYRTTALVSHARKVMLKVLQARLQQYMTWELHSPHIQTVDSKCTVMPQRWSRQRHTMWFYLCLSETKYSLQGTNFFIMKNLTFEYEISCWNWKICFKVKFFNCQLFWDMGKKKIKLHSLRLLQFSSVAQLCPTLFIGGCLNFHRFFFLKTPLQFYSLN